MVCKRAPEKAEAALKVWMGTAQDSLLASFTRGLERDRSAVQAALTDHHSETPAGFISESVAGFNRNPQSSTCSAGSGVAAS